MHELPTKVIRCFGDVDIRNGVKSNDIFVTISSAFQAKTGQPGEHKNSCLNRAQFTAEFMLFRCGAKASAAALQMHPQKYYDWRDMRACSVERLLGFPPHRRNA